MQVLGVGTHIVECLRIARLIDRYGELFIARVYTPREIEYCSARLAATQHYAAHWSAKAAVLSAVGLRGRRRIGVRDVEIRCARNGSMRAILRGPARDALRGSGIRRLHVSTSYCRNYAAAFAIAEGEHQG